VKIVDMWVSGDGFVNYPDPQYAHDYDRLADPLFSDCPVTEVPNGQSVPFNRGEIILADLRGGHRVIITDIAKTQEGFEYEGILLSADNGSRIRKGWVRVNDYCYLVCRYNKCSYLRLFVNREEMLGRLLRADASSTIPQTFEIGSNSDLVLENSVTGNLTWTIERFAREGRGKLTFPTKFDMVSPLLGLDHRGKTIFRMSVNPAYIVDRVELGTSPLGARIRAVNDMAEAGYPTGLLIAPVILLPGWKAMYSGLIDILACGLSEKVRRGGFIEIILMTYSFVQDAINSQAFPNAQNVFDRTLMTGCGRGKYRYRPDARARAETFLREEIKSKLGMPVIYIA
jgi:spore photoproduct lyase